MSSGGSATELFPSGTAIRQVNATRTVIGAYRNNLESCELPGIWT